MQKSIKCKVINKEQLIQANRLAIKSKFVRFFLNGDLKDVYNIEGDTVFPIHYSVKRQPDCYRVLFEYVNGELYQLDIGDDIYNSLEEREISFLSQ